MTSTLIRRAKDISMKEMIAERTRRVRLEKRAPSRRENKPLT